MVVVTPAISTSIGQMTVYLIQLRTNALVFSPIKIMNSVKSLAYMK